MNKRESNKLSMFNSVIALMDSNLTAVSTIPVIGETLTAFKSLVDEIKNGSLEFKGETKDETADKNLKEDTLHSKIFKISSALFVLGVKTKNSDLMINAKLNKSEMEVVRDNLLCSKCVTVLAKANQYKTELVNYGVNEEMITGAQTALDDFQGAIGKQSEEYADISAARMKLTNLFNEATLMLNDEMDPMMELFEDSDSDFYNAYQSARFIKDLGIKKSVPVIDEESVE